MGEFGLASSFASFFHFIPSKHTNLKVTHTTTPFDSHQTKIERWVNSSVVSAFRLCRLLICYTFTATCLPPHRCLISSPLPTTCCGNGLDGFFFLVLISLLGSFVKLCYKQKDKRNEESGVSELQRGQSKEMRGMRNEESGVIYLLIYQRG